MMASHRAPSIEQQTAASLRRLAELNAEGDQARAEVTEVRADLAQLVRAVEAAELRLDGMDAGQLLEANQQLVLSSLRAQSDTEDCEAALKQRARAAQYDALTDLPNREMFLERFNHAISTAQRDARCLALFFVDLNNFKAINDTLGHRLGDQVLQGAARSMSELIGEDDMLCRYGGDEFLILLASIEDAAAASQFAQQVTAALAMPHRLGEHVLRLSASIGICLFPEDGETPELLIDRADAAMYRAKRMGSGYCVFHGNVDEETVLHLPLTLGSLTHPVNHFEHAVADHERRAGQLSEANQALVFAALSAQELQAAAEQSSQRQREFLALVAHELRNPMTPLVVAASLLRGSDPLDLERLRQIIEEQVAHMNRMVGDLLDMSRSDTGKLRLAMRQVTLRTIIETAIDATRPAMDIRLQHFNVKLPPQPITMEADPMRLVQILGNLLDNASKYTPQGGEIHLSIVADDAHVVIEVTDNGIGISAEALPRVFEPFAQDLHATAFNAYGLGLGLSVVKQLVEGHSGTVVVSSAGIGKGTAFTVTLPLQRVSVDPPALTRAG